MPKAISLFAGAGGFCEGVSLAGFKVLCAVESDRAACETHAANFQSVALYRGDIARFLRETRDEVPSREQLIKAKIDLVYGGPPCQGFSQIGPRIAGDPRNNLYQHFVRVVRELQPALFIMENVPNMLAMHDGQFRKRIVRAFRNAGYSRSAVLPLRASDFGVPQHRRRIFIFGLRDGLRLQADLQTLLEDFLTEQRVEPPVTVREAISDLPARVSAADKPLSYPRTRSGTYSAYQRLMRLDRNTALLSAKRKCRGRVKKLYNHHTKGIEARRRKIVKAIRPGSTGDSLPASLWNGSRDHKWRRLHPNKPSYTILAQMHRDLSEWIHPTRSRWITVREAARLQSFDDGFVFHGSECQQLKQVGNAVPPLMAYAVARAARKVLRRVGSARRHRR